MDQQPRSKAATLAVMVWIVGVMCLGTWAITSQIYTDRAEVADSMADDLLDIVELKAETEAGEQQAIIDALTQEVQELKAHTLELATLQPVLGLLGPDDINLIIELLEPASPFNSKTRVTSRFGEGRGYQGSLRRGHLGNDLVPEGDWYVTPMWEGVVNDIGIDAYLGKYIVIEHSPRVRTRLAHLDTIYYAALPGERVDSDTIVGIMGNTGNSDGAHLHLELQVFDGDRWVAIDIYPWLEGHG